LGYLTTMKYYNDNSSKLSIYREKHFIILKDKVKERNPDFSEKEIEKRTNEIIDCALTFMYIFNRGEYEKALGIK
jgi:hypothetical protein